MTHHGNQNAGNQNTGINEFDPRSDNKSVDVPTPWTDWLGVSASIACAIHCAAMPVVLMMFPMTGLGFFADESFHQFMVFACLLLAAVAFIPGLRVHRRLLPSGLAGIGLAMIATAAFALEGECCASCAAVTASSGEETQVCTEACCQTEDLESTEREISTDQEITGESTSTTLATLLGPMKAWITPLGGMVLVSAHLTNRRLTSRCGCCHDQSDSECEA